MGNIESMLVPIKLRHKPVHSITRQTVQFNPLPCCKSLITNITLKWLDSNMVQHVALQFMVKEEFFAAEVAGEIFSIDITFVVVGLWNLWFLCCTDVLVGSISVQRFLN